MNCLIVDDHEVFRHVLKKMVSLDQSLVLIGECSDSLQAQLMIAQHPIDIVFLDIQMPGINGMELAWSLKGQRPMVIFTTSVSSYATEAFDVNAIDFLVKPISPSRFLKAVEKARTKLSEQRLDLFERVDDFLFIRDSNIIRKLKSKDVLYLEATGDYVKIYLTDQTYSIHSSLKSVGAKLPENSFLKVHRSFIVNLARIDAIEGGALIIDKKAVPVSDSYRTALNKRIKFL